MVKMLTLRVTDDEHAAFKSKVASEKSTISAVLKGLIDAYMRETKGTECAYPHSELRRGQECPGCGR